jgi:hypothetical protein
MGLNRCIGIYTMNASRLNECLKVLKDIQELGIPVDYPPLKELSKRMTDYVKTGDPWAGKLKMEAYGRYADVVLPRKKDIPITVVLRKLT